MKFMLKRTKSRGRRIFNFLFQLVWTCTIISIAGCGTLSFNSLEADLLLDFNSSQFALPVTSSQSPIFSEESIFESIPKLTGSHAATITAFADGELLAAWYSYPGEDELAGSRIYMSRKVLGSDRWTDPELHIDRPEGDGNPVLYSEGDRVWFFQAVVSSGWSTARIEFQISDDRGKTWSAPAILSDAPGSNTKYPPIRLADGTLLLPAYDDLWSRSLFFSSQDGEKWNLLSSVRSNPGNLQPSIVQLIDGRLLAVMRNKSQGWLWAMNSDNQGRSWSPPQDSHFFNPASASQIVRLSNGKLVLIFNDSPQVRRPLSIAISADEGKTWSSSKILADGPAKYSYPFAIESPDGLIHIVYSLDRLRIQHITLNEVWITAK